MGSEVGGRWTYGTQIPARTRNIARLRQLNIRTPIPQPINPQPRQRDDILLLLPTRELHREARVPDLLDDDGPAGEGRLLGVVALQGEPLGRVGDEVGGDGGVVRDLLDDEVGLTAVVLVGPVAVEEPMSAVQG